MYNFDYYDATEMFMIFVVAIKPTNLDYNSKSELLHHFSLFTIYRQKAVVPLPQ